MTPGEIQQNSPNNPKAGTTFRLPEQNVHTSKVEVFYLPQYLWTMNADGRLIERTIRKHSTLSADYTNNQSSPFYAWPTMRLTAMDITSDQYLIYFKGREVWTADLHGLLAHHG